MDKVIVKSTFVLFCLLGFLSVKGHAQSNKVVKGQVFDQSTGKTMPGVNVIVKGHNTIGTSTNSKGEFTLSVPSLSDTLVFSYIGYQRKSVPIKKRGTINVRMKPKTFSGQQLVVVGYGAQRQQDVTGSVSQIDSSQFNVGQVSNPAGLIQGKVAGLDINKPGGNPNGNYTIRLRGINTLGPNAQPLIVLNGVPGASLSNIDPNDIKSMSVLKSASASAIYGTEGSNGVILITTKSGSSGQKSQFHVEYKGQLTVNTPYREVKVFNASQFRNFLHFYSKETGQDLSTTDLGHSTNWYNQITRDGINQQQYIALSGGNSDNNYRASLNYRKNEGLLKKTGYTKIDARLRLHQSAVNNKLQFDLNLSANRKNAQYGFPQAFRYATVYNPTAPVKSNSPQDAKYGNYFQQALFQYYNPVSIVEQNTNEGRINNIDGSLKGSYHFDDLIPGLQVSALYSERHTKISGGVFYPSTGYWRGYSRSGVATRSDTSNYNRLLRTTIHYQKTIGDVNFKLLGGYSWQKFTYANFSMNGGNFITDHFGYNNMGAAQEFQQGLGTVGSYKENHKLISGFGRLNLRFKDLFLLSGSIRREGSSRFGINNKWGTFYSVNGGIHLANLLDLPNVQQLKLRAGYGVTGNDAPHSYLSKLRYGPQGYFMVNGNYVPTYGPVNNPNPNLKWEVKHETDVGIDFALLNNRLTGTIDAYTDKTNDLLLNFNVPVPPNLYNTEWVNIGELSNKGIELTANYQTIHTKNFTWKTGVTASLHNKTKIVSLSNKNLSFGNQQLLDYAGAPGLTSTPLVRVKEGQPLGQLWGYVYQGITSDGHWKFKDLNGDGTINASGDKTVIGNGLPKATAGWHNTFSYKNWNLSFFFRGVFGHDLLNTYRLFYQNPNRIVSKNVLKSTMKVKNLVDGTAVSSFFVQNASFVQLHNATLGYSIPLKNLKSISSIRLSLTGQNIFIITNYSGPDPSPRYSDNGSPLQVGVARRNSWFNSRRVTFSIDLKL